MIRWGIIGVGNVTEVKSGPALQLAEHSSLVAVMRRTGAMAEDYARRHGVPRWYDDAQALIDDPDVDAIYIATPPESHMIYTLAAARAGKPVYVEKPMALNHAQCRVMIEGCRAAGVPLCVAYYRRALPRFLKVKALVDELGDLRFVRMTLTQRRDVESGQLPWRYIPEMSGGGIFVDMASHMLDFLDFVLGPIQRVAGFAANQAALYPAEDVVVGSFEFTSGVYGTGTWSFHSYEERDLIEIAGTKGKVSFACFADTPVVFESERGTQEFQIENPPHIQQPLIQQVVNALIGRRTCSSTGDTAARTNWVMDQLLSDYYQR